jgi:hypothetical protein
MVLSDLLNTDVVCRTGAPTPDLYDFTGVVSTRPLNDTSHSASRQESATPHYAPSSSWIESSIDAQHVLLKGTRLKSTRWVYGLCIMTGKDTKVTAAEPWL